MEELQWIWERAKRIYLDSNISQHEKDIRLANLMTRLELWYKIPMFRDEQWEAENPLVIKLYREISNMRKL